MSNEEIASRLQSVISRHRGLPGTIHNLRQLTGGASRSTWLFDAETGGARHRLIMQSGGVWADRATGLVPQLEPEQDAQLMIAASEVGVPAPKVRAVLEPADGLGRGYITDFVEGETLGQRIVRDEKFAGARALMAKQCGEILAAIHRIDPRRVPFLMHQDGAAHIAAHREIVDRFGLQLPALDMALKWAAENVPKDPRHTVVHGDFRLGNLIVGDDGIRCVLDWELGQSGDPMQDLGWLCIRTWRFGGAAPVGGFASREDLYTTYERASGYSINPAHVRFWEAFGNVKWVIHCLRLGMRGVAEVGIERCAIGRRIEEPLWDFLNLIEGRRE
jgi:aminoglycoside phosphotransferase (APT) family kinase protein